MTTGKSRQLARAGMLIALGLLLPATLRPCLTLHPTQAGVLCALSFAGTGLVGFLLATALWNRVLLGGRLHGELGRGNLAAGVVAAAHAAAFGIVAAHTFAADTLATLPVGAIFFVVSVLALVALSLLFRGLTSYADDQEILGENLAAATSYSGLVL
ncbi:MAG TPA: hypothetical protein VF524_06560, partial [Polyangia bacterium]